MSTTRPGLVARTVATAAAGTALVATTGLTTPAAAADPPVADPGAAAAHHLEQQLADSGYLLQSFGYPDPGLTADAVLALDASGTGQAAAAQATSLLAGDIVAYTGFGDPTEIYAGSVAKLVNVAVAQGMDPSAFGGTGEANDLVTTLQSLQDASGRYSDQSGYGDYSNVFGQSFALIGLHRAGVGALDAGRDYLRLQQCPGGGFRLDMADTACADAATSDPDATAMAVQALLAVDPSDPAAQSGLDYLVAVQGADGGVGGAGPQSGTNANSTGLAGQAFVAGGRTAPAQSAVAFLEGLQYGCSFPGALHGAVAYDAAAYESAVGAGGAATPNDEDRRSTTQALLAFAGVPLDSVTGAGAASETSALECSASSTSSSSTTSATTASSSASTTADGRSTTDGKSGTSGTTSAAAAGSSADTSPSAAATSPTGALAQTGSGLLVPGLVGVALLALGVLAVWGSRRRGRHA